MQLRIAVADPLPVFRHGVRRILHDAGFESDAPEDLAGWVRDEQVRAVVLTIRSETDWELLEELHHSRSEVVLVALLDQVSVAASVRALRAGAACVVARDASPSALSEAFAAAVRGQSLVPVEVLRALSRPPEPASDRPTPDQRKWLRGLAAGRTVGQIAVEAGYSERMMFRLLRELYTRLGAENRTDAIVRAQARGWL
ncbi:hypothetical protein GCM10020358_67090 [Amorphoplanes nipponensis]|uniref:Response regulatory domain-containing protein n=1 Tax=Actinoplanes nipponensis TaxID=135950 RepID=A0A919JVK5_9ACTN|nr:response regulator transcription factor [Actinoplanes nipponensis]GIE53799.1 hypothetical protein Ani05nite_73330 [Actinoplanes nipponensis]